VRLSDLERAAGVPLATAHREVERLERAGLVESTRMRRERRVLANRASPFFPELQSLLVKAFGPIAVLRGLLERISGVEEAYVFGSWARRSLGVPGRAARDIDVLVIGDVDPDAVYAAARDAEAALGREVDATILSRAEWDGAAEGFALAVRAEPRVRIVPA
jgi:predicted nucleotidyltransferase